MTWKGEKSKEILDTFSPSSSVILTISKVVAVSSSSSMFVSTAFFNGILLVVRPKLVAVHSVYREQLTY